MLGRAPMGTPEGAGAELLGLARCAFEVVGRVGRAIGEALARGVGESGGGEGRGRLGSAALRVNSLYTWQSFCISLLGMTLHVMSVGAEGRWWAGPDLTSPRVPGSSGRAEALQICQRSLFHQRGCSTRFGTTMYPSRFATHFILPAALGDGFRE